MTPPNSSVTALKSLKTRYCEAFAKAVALGSITAVLISCGTGPQEAPLTSTAESTPKATVIYKGITIPAPNVAISGVQAYTSTYSAAQGASISFHLSDASGSTITNRKITANVYRLGLAEELVATSSVAARKQSIPTNAWQSCCNWPVSWKMPVPSTWKSGVYRADFSLGSSVSNVYFVVKSSTPGALSKTVLQVPFHTAQAYNNWGNKSLYEFNSSSSVKADRVSMFRPNLAMEGEIGRWIVPFIRWAEKENIALEYIASTDMDQATAALSAYRLFVTVGHDEYWSSAMRSQYDTFIASGGNAAILSGNSMWWKVDNIADSYGRKGGVMLATKVQGSTTGNWYESNPEGKSIGASFVRGAYVDETSNPAATQIGYKVIDETHWAFAGTNLAKGASFGQEERILRYEADGVDFRYDAQGIPRATGGDTVPSSTQILGLVALNNWVGNTSALRPAPGINLSGEAGSWAAVTLFQNKGWVFNAGTTDWARGLVPCTDSAIKAPVCTVTKNVLQTLGGLTPPPTPTPTPTPTPPPPPPPPPPAANIDPDVATIQRYSAANSTGGLRYLFSQDLTLSGEWTSEARAFYGLKNAKAGSVVINRFSYTQADGKKRYVLSNGTSVGGNWVLEGAAFSAYDYQVTGTVVVNEFYKVLSDGWHLTYDLSSSLAGWTLSGPVFFVPQTNTK